MPFMSRARSKLSYSNIGMTACLLLLMAVVGAGQAYAVASITGAEVVDESLTGADVKDYSMASRDLGTDSVGYRAIQFGSIVRDHLANETLNGSKIEDGSLTGREIADGSLDAVDLNMQYEIVRSDSFIVQGGVGSTAVKVATCPLGKRVLSGGFDSNGAVALEQSFPSGHNMWQIRVFNLGPNSLKVWAYAICAKLG